MSDLLTVSAAERAEPRLRLGAAVLPESFRYTDGPADVVGLVGDAEWAANAAAALDDGARGVLVVDPRPVSGAALDGLRAAASRRAAPVILDRGWASSPSVLAAAEEFARLVVPTALVETRVDVPGVADPEAALLAHLALVRATVGAVTELRLLHADSTGYSALGRLGAAVDLDLTAVFSAALTSAASVRIARPESTVLLELGPVDVAAPGRLRVLDGAVRRLPLLPYETPHRAAWRRLHRAATGGGPTADLDDFGHDVELARRALSSGVFGPGSRVAR